MYPGGIDGVLESGDITGAAGVATCGGATENGSYVPGACAGGGAGVGTTGLNVNGSGVGCGANVGAGAGAGAALKGEGARAAAALPASGAVTGARSSSMAEEPGAF